MYAIAGLGRRAPLLALSVAGCLLPVIVVAATHGVSARLVLAVAVLALVVAFQQTLLSWRTLLTVLVLMILLIPIRTYTLPFQVSGNFKLEPYRAFVAVIVFAWAFSLLADPRVRARASGLEWVFLLIGVSTFASVVVNIGSIQALGVQTEVVKSLVFFASFFLVFYFVVSVVRTQADIDRVLKLLVAGGAFVAGAAIIESRTQFNVFDHLRTVFPFLQFNVVVDPNSDLNQFTRGGEARVFGSAEHPIALSALLVMLLPLALYLIQTTRKKVWIALAALLLLGALATLSRTGIVMLLVIAVVYLTLRTRSTARMWPALIPTLLVVHFALPHTLGVLKTSLFPSGGVGALVTEQNNAAQSRRSSGRLADVRPTIQQVSQSNPLLGLGFGSRVVEGPLANARILDDQWLGTLLETGFLGLIAWVWLFVRFLRRSMSEARRDLTERGWLLVALSASVASFGIGMVLFDALAFTQETLVFFLILALGTIALKPRTSAAPRRRGATR
jgi:O-antigen ligase